MDYLDAQIGLRASGILPALHVRPPAWRAAAIPGSETSAPELPAPSHPDMDYLDSVLGQTAPGSELEPPPRPPVWRLLRPVAPARSAAEPVREERELPEPPPPRDPMRSSDTPLLRAPAAAAFALVALGIAVLVHFLAPNAMAGYSRPELDLTVQMRAVEWLLAGILVALVGLLIKR